MNNLKFNAWDSEEKKMFTWIYIIQSAWRTTGFIHDILTKTRYDKLLFSGFTDSKGDELYAGDLLEGKGAGIKYFEIRYEEGGFVVYNNLGRWGTLARLFEISKDDKYSFECTRIGNIYENKEILENA